LAGKTFCEFAVVDSVFDSNDGDDTHLVSVTLKDTGVALPRIPLASLASGWFVLPRAGDTVLVLFPRGSLESAVVFGQVYSEKRRPPEAKAEEAVIVWPGDSDDNEKNAIDIRLSADGSTRSFTLNLGGEKDAQVKVTDGEITLTAGGIVFTLKHSSSLDGTAELAAGGTTLTLKQDGDCTIESAGALTLKGASVKIEGDTEVTINGQTVAIN
jgi:phage baseplate assembly protein gpV